jgi:hypothetical protein
LSGARIKPGDAPVDIRYYMTDANTVTQATEWSSSRTVEMTLDEVLEREPLLA